MSNSEIILMAVAVVIAIVGNILEIKDIKRGDKKC